MPVAPAARDARRVGLHSRAGADRSDFVFLQFLDRNSLQQDRGFSLADVGYYAWIPFAAGAVATSSAARCRAG